MPIRRHQDPHYEVSPAPQPLPMPIRRHHDSHHVSPTEIRKRRKVTTDGRYNKKYVVNNIRYAKQVVQWLVAVAKTSTLKSGLMIQPHHEGWWRGWWFDWQ